MALKIYSVENSFILLNFFFRPVHRLPQHTTATFDVGQVTHPGAYLC